MGGGRTKAKQSSTAAANSFPPQRAHGHFAGPGRKWSYWGRRFKMRLRAPKDGGCKGRYKEKGGADKENEQDGGAQ